MDARDDRNLITARGPEPDDLLTHPAIGMALVVFHVRDDEYRVAVWRVADSRCGKRDHGLTCAEDDLGLHEHARPKFRVWIGERRLHLNVAGRFIDRRVDRRDTSVERDIAETFGGDAHVAADAGLGDRLLRNTEVHVDGIERLQRDERIAAGEVLSL